MRSISVDNMLGSGFDQILLYLCLASSLSLRGLIVFMVGDPACRLDAHPIVA